MTLLEAIGLCVAYPEARMTFTVKRPEKYGGGHFGTGTIDVIDHVNDVSFRAHGPSWGHRPDGVTIPFEDVTAWHLSLEATS